VVLKTTLRVLASHAVDLYPLPLHLLLVDDLVVDGGVDSLAEPVDAAAAAVHAVVDRGRVGALAGVALPPSALALVVPAPRAIVLLLADAGAAVGSGVDVYLSPLLLVLPLRLSLLSLALLPLLVAEAALDDNDDAVPAASVTVVVAVVDVAVVAVGIAAVGGAGSAAAGFGLGDVVTRGVRGALYTVAAAAAPVLGRNVETESVVALAVGAPPRQPIETAGRRRESEMACPGAVAYLLEWGPNKLARFLGPFPHQSHS
jgi:hypothetical protein